MLFLRVLMAAFSAAIFSGLCGLGNAAWADSPAQKPTYVFPDTAIALQDGDIVLTDTPKLSSTLIRQLGNPTGPYSHAAVFIEFPDGTAKMVGYTDHGIKEIDPTKYLSEKGRLALVRPLAQPNTGSLADAYTQLAKRPLVFDFDMRWPSVESNKTYCAGFISQLFRMSGAPENDPYKKPTDYQRPFWDDWALQQLGLNLSPIVSPNAVLKDAHFKLLSEYQTQNQAQNIEHWIAETTFQTLMHYIEQDQLSIAPIKLGSRLALQLSKMGLMEEMDLLNMPEQRLKVFIPLWEYSEMVKARVNRLIFINEDQNWDETSVRALTKSVADYYRDNYFVSPKHK